MQWAFFSNWRNAISEIAKTPKIKEVNRTPYIERALHHVPFLSRSHIEKNWRSEQVCMINIKNSHLQEPNCLRRKPLTGRK